MTEPNDMDEFQLFYDDIQISDINIIHETEMKSVYKSVVYANMDKFFPIPIQEYFQKCNNYIKMQSVRCGITFHIYYCNKLPTTMDKLNRAFRQAYMIKHFLKLSKEFEIYIVLSPFKRFMPLKGMIDTIHINGGFTDTSDNKIFIVREEEFAKVIVHELIHHCKLIDNHDWTHQQITALKQAFNIADETRLIPNEAVVELWATLIYCLFNSFEYKKPFHKILNIEIKHSINLCQQILQKQANKPWMENTNAYCYIIFKTILLQNLQMLNGYTYPYNPQYITDFLIKYKHTINVKSPIKELTSRRSSSRRSSLRMMALSDL